MLMSQGQPTCEMWKELYDALREHTSGEETLDKDEFADETLEWFNKHAPADARRPPKEVLYHIFDKYLDADHNGTVSKEELEAAIAEHKKHEGC